MYDALLGGKDNYEADRALAGDLTTTCPDLPEMLAAHRRLLARVVRFLVADAGLRQLLDVGTGIPNGETVHDIARRIAPETRVVYVDNDPFVLAHARALLRDGPASGTAVVDGDLRDPERLLWSRALRRVLDIEQPVGVILANVLQHVPPSDRPLEAVRALLAGLPSGSHLAVVAPASDLRRDLVAALVRRAAAGGIAVTPRSRDEVAAFVDGLEPVPPGVEQLLDWRPGDDDLDQVLDIPAWVAVARKP